MNRYLVDANGRLLVSRGHATLMAFGGLGVAFIVLTLGGFLLNLRVAGGALLLALGGVAFVASLILMWRELLRGTRELKGATAAWQAGQGNAAIPAAHYVLRNVFRADIRARALHLLGLVAEAEGDFAAACDCFERALSALPAMAAPVRKRYAEILIASHQALCLSALGNLPLAAQQLDRAGQRLAIGDATSTWDALTDDAGWGLGDVSMNEVLMKIEGGRPAAGVFALAQALFAFRSGDAQRCLHGLGASYGQLVHALLPREHGLAALLNHRAQRIVGHNPNGPEPRDPWALKCVGEVPH